MKQGAHGNSGLVSMSRCGEHPRQGHGAWVFKGTRMPVATVFENLEAGLTVEEVTGEFFVTRQQINAVLHFAAKSLGTPPPRLSRMHRRPLMLILFEHGTPHSPKHRTLV